MQWVTLREVYNEIFYPSLPREKGPEGLLLLPMFRPLSHFTLSWSKDHWVLGRKSSFS